MLKLSFLLWLILQAFLLRAKNPAWQAAIDFPLVHTPFFLHMLSCTVSQNVHTDVSCGYNFFLGRKDHHSRSLKGSVVLWTITFPEWAFFLFRSWFWVLYFLVTVLPCFFLYLRVIQSVTGKIIRYFRLGMNLRKNSNWIPWNYSKTL